MAKTTSSHDPQSPPPAGRRDFLTRMLAVACGGLATLTPVLAGLWMLLDPLRRRGAAAAFLPVTDLASLPDDGLPRQFPVLADRVDAWTGFAAEPIGRRLSAAAAGLGDRGALSATCPHAGCFVEIDAQEKCFRCPCHNSRFGIDGSIMPPSPSPRGMDSLECRVGKQGVAVKWQNFYTGVAGKVARP